MSCIHTYIDIRKYIYIYSYILYKTAGSPCSCYLKLGMLLRVGKHGCGKSFLLVTALVTWLACLPIMRTCYYACANSVLNAHLRPGFPTLTLFNVLNVIKLLNTSSLNDYFQSCGSYLVEVIYYLILFTFKTLHG